MSFALDRLKVVLRSSLYRESLSLRPRQSWGLLKYLMQTRPVWRDGLAELNAYSSPVGGEAYRRHLRGLSRIRRGEWTPLVAHVSLLDRCPYSCERCSNLSKLDHDPPLADIAKLIETLRAAGASRIAFTGGEPTLRKDLPEIIRLCGDELAPLLFTSGYAVDADLSRRLRESGLTAAFVSLDSDSPDEHNTFRRDERAFQQAIQAVRNFLESGVYTAIQTVVSPPLLRDGRIDRFLDFCKQLGVHEVMLLEPVPVGGRKCGQRLDPLERDRLINLHLRSVSDSRSPKVSSMAQLERPECLGCQAGFTFIYVSTSGDVFPCDFVPVSFGNVYEEELPIIQKRISRALKRPSKKCLALRFQDFFNENAAPVKWTNAQTPLDNYEPGPLPDLFKYLYDER